MRWILLALSFCLFACTTDDPGKKQCEIGTSDPDYECVNGYVCKCTPDGCFCEKESGLVVSPQPAPNNRTSAVEDPNIRFLKRLGVYEATP